MNVSVHSQSHPRVHKSPRPSELGKMCKWSGLRHSAEKGGEKRVQVETARREKGEIAGGMYSNVELG